MGGENGLGLQPESNGASARCLSDELYPEMSTPIKGFVFFEIGLLVARCHEKST